MVDWLPESQYNYYLTTTGTAMKTNKELNQAHDKAQAERVRPKAPEYNWEPLEAVIRQWILNGK